ncbi:DUF3883 domain-containing protein [Bifidobacterium sp. W8117]|nr:DUF3883 domain-containing protein [Bifidobacterium polysaccharolyticum]
MVEQESLSSVDLRQGLTLSGVIPNQLVKVVSTEPIGDVINLYYETADGKVSQEIIDDAAFKELRIVQPGQKPKLDADPEEFRLAAEALRINCAALYDPMSAVYSSSIDPLPHQIRAVYEDMLPKVPLRFLLADDPGAGKTIMAGLYIKEMLLRSAAVRIIIVCPGGLADQWRDELTEKFNLHFDVFQPFMQDQAPSGNPFRDQNRLIVRMDQVARNDDFQRMLSEVKWDIAIVDEAHRMSAHYKNNYGDIDLTKRFKLGETLASTSENLLLMTATPHSGKEEDFQLFMSLLDKDRFAGQWSKKKRYITDTKGLMRRMVKEELLTFEGKPLFPERKAETVEYALSEGESRLYKAVTDYVRGGMNAAQRIRQVDGRRGSSIGFALTILQRRLASSPEAIYQSLRRRRDRLNDLLQSIEKNPYNIENILEPAADAPDDSDEYDDMWVETGEDGQGQLELTLDEVMDSATAAQTVEELRSEISQLDSLVAQAREVRHSGTDTKWTQLSDILNNNVLNAGTSEQPHKLIVFTEHRDTLNYLSSQIRTLLGKPESVVTIHGGMNHDERKAVQERFMNDPSVRILVATDAAGEGLNLQRADLMVNYDLPWNPNRIEQRFGRIHRIGQKRSCSLWNLVAKNTREGEVYGKLLEKIETIGKAYDGRLFNVLGDGKAFDGKSLKDLMLDAIKHGDNPKVQARLNEVIDSSVNKGLNDLINERSAHPDRYSTVNVEEVRRLMEKTRERKLQPGYISAFFVPAFRKLGGTIHLRETNRWEITHVPQDVRHMGETINRHQTIADAYERITFEPSLTHIDDGPDAVLVAPGTPLLDAVSQLIIKRYGAALVHGTVFVDRTDSQPDEPVVMVAAEQTITNPEGKVVSKHFDYLQLPKQGEVRFSPAPPYLDYDRPHDDEKAEITKLMNKDSQGRDYIGEMRQYVYTNGTKPRIKELQARQDAENEHLLVQIHNRLHAESEFWWKLHNKLSEKERNGEKRGKNMNSDIARKRAEEYEQRLKKREHELTGDTRLRAKSPTMRGIALIVPERLVAPIDKVNASRLFAKNTEDVDCRAITMTMNAERKLGRTPEEMPHNNKGFDIKSTDKLGYTYFIEVKGRIDLPDVDTFTVTANEVAFAQSQGDRHRLALVKVSPRGAEHDRLRYVEHAFDLIAPADTTRSFNESLQSYWERGVTPC